MALEYPADHDGARRPRMTRPKLLGKACIPHQASLTEEVLAHDEELAAFTEPQLGARTAPPPSLLVRRPQGRARGRDAAATQASCRGPCSRWRIRCWRWLPGKHLRPSTPRHARPRPRGWPPEAAAMAAATEPSASPSPPPVCFGVLGCARIARKVVRAMHKASGVDPRAVGSRSLAKAREFAAEAGLATAYGSYQEVLDDPDVDAVYVPLPTGLHREWVVKAAAAGKHVLLEKPPAPDAAEMEEMLAACAEAGVQLMDGTMWMHNPRAAAMARHIEDRSAFGRPSRVNASLSFWAADEFLATNIRCKPGLDGLGCLGDVGWYCIRAALWAFDSDMPHRVAAHPDPKLNAAGVVMSCGATLTWPDGRVAVFDCGFDAPFRQSLEIVGTRAVLELKDFIIPFREDECSFTITSAVALKDFSTWISKEEVNHKVKLRVPQEALMLEKFASLVAGIRSGRGKVDPYWPSIARKTQAVLSAVDQSIKGGSCIIQLNSVHASA